jgi:hypothetical protein
MIAVYILPPGNQRNQRNLLLETCAGPGPWNPCNPWFPKSLRKRVREMFLGKQHFKD